MNNRNRENVLEKVQPCLSYSEITDDIKVTVLPEYLPEDSDPDHGVYAFSYTVTIENFGAETVQLLRRHWVISSAGSLYSEVSGEGVVGEKPILGSSEGFQYTSWSVIKDPTGSMRGAYTFQSDKGRSFEVAIPEFDLVCPDSLH